MQHCLIYLRQMVMCSSDTALEHDVLLPNGTTIRLDDGTVRTCRNFDELSSMLHWYIVFGRRTILDVAMWI
jgi:hypothetical protein